MRLTPPTTGTFTLAVLAIAAGIGVRMGWVDVLDGYDFWLVSAGAGLLLVGVIFKRV